jgi:hypothetical protein
MVRQVRGLGTLVRAEDSAKLFARVTLPDFMAHGVQLNRNAAVRIPNGRPLEKAISSLSPGVSATSARHLQTERAAWALPSTVWRSLPAFDFPGGFGAGS